MHLLEETIDEKFDEKVNGLSTVKDIMSLRIEIKEEISDLRTEIKEVKVDMIKWYVALFIMLTVMIVGLYLK